MELSELTSFFSDAIYLAVLMVLVLISPGLLLGLLIAIFQAATQVNEQTLSFLPKLVLTLLMVLFAGQWLVQKLLDLFNQLFLSIPHVIG
ncbi:MULTISPECIES: flagellar biosynthetic protein FliQ [Shewanella]|jgi:flagellar biosynthetic protein FliQ|uniref:Flagellar biosynthetic protein FliQ n=3 Tax=Bacteria TaxID=2 RepID=A0A379ZEJ7_9GAMM|nr:MULTISPECIES: flagellar biosynthetic protein FliQ [Shewanella]AXQ14226.1 flagellar biosynthetic protein FliQ [Shewanella algae]AYV11682.1 flagellar biosynthetic protein FliQ [Shewanella algae]EKT4487926.1 flagellar biosynthetic protein FliQ [Shewanella algae]MBC8794887.1 flagellar biosynthetic protein FliQ [Shewanella algae]MBO2550229.1 flagellar biosynthetic protein FliQ [Shewanella algae]